MGEGILVSQFGDIYKGTFKSNLRHGLLHYTSTDGKVFIYEMKEGKPDGK